MTVACPDGLWYYVVDRGIGTDKLGGLSEREEADDVLHTYNRLRSTLMSLKYGGNVTEGKWTISVNGHICPELDFDCTAFDIQAALENAPAINPDDVEVFGAFDAILGGVMYLRFVGQYAGTTAPTISVDYSALGGDAPSIELETIASPGGSGIVVREVNDSYWLFNGRAFASQGRKRKWNEGVLADSIVDAIVPRSLGMFLLSSTGRILRVGVGLTPFDSEPPRWYYESPWMVGERVQVVGLKSDVLGQPSFRMYMDDGANGITYKDFELSEQQFSTLDSVTMPGVRIKFVASGRFAIDKIKSVALQVEAIDGDSFGS